MDGWNRPASGHRLWIGLGDELISRLGRPRAFRAVVFPANLWMVFKLWLELEERPFMNERRRFLVKANLIVSLAPWLNLLAFTTYAFTARFFAGSFTPGMDEFRPGNSIISRVFDGLTSLTAGLQILSAPVWLGMLLWRDMRWKDPSVWRAGVIGGLGWATGLWLWCADPTGFMGWLCTQ